jgi:hypothetical protein
MRKFLFIAAVALLGTLGLGACSKNQSEATTTPAKVTRPTTADVDAAVKACQAKHPNAAAPASTGTAAAPAASGASSSSAPSLQGSGDDSSQDNPCERATISASVWQAYMQQVVTDNMGNITSQPYAYFVPSGQYPENQDSISRVQGQLDDMVTATVLPGNLVAVGGPSSATSAQVLENAFKQAAPGSFKGVVVLFIGDKADEAAVKAAIDPSGATFKFAQM